MTNEEKRLIEACRVMVIGSGDFIRHIRAELSQLGFGEARIVAPTRQLPATDTTGIIIEFTNTADCQTAYTPAAGSAIPIIIPFDLVAGAGAIVLLPGDNKELLTKRNIRIWAAEYMAGYCAFWNVEGCEWLREALPAIKEGLTSDTAQRTAAHISARIAANIAVGREIKHFPRFYLAEN